MLQMTEKESEYYFCLANAHAFVFLCRTYFPLGNDVSAMWMDCAGHCFQYSEAGGGGSLLPKQAEVDLIRNPQVIADGGFSVSEFADIQEKMLSLGILSLPDEVPSLGVPHVSNLVAIRMPTGEENGFRVNTGFYSDTNIGKILDLITNVSLDGFYWKMRNGDRERKPTNRW